MFRDLDDDTTNYATEPGKYLDVPYVPSEEDVVEAMLSLAKVTSKDVIYDLGCGDGRILIAAARERDARGVGVDIDPVRIADAMEYAGWAGVEYLVDFVEEDIFTVDIREATVVTLYLLQTVNEELRPRLLSELRPGARIISHAFDMGDWKPDETIRLSTANIHKWIVPAQVAGIWSWEGADGKSYRAELQQEYQMVSGTIWQDDREVGLESAHLCGTRLELEIREDEAGPLRKLALNFTG